jgi:hypothetical protein
MLMMMIMMIIVPLRLGDRMNFPHLTESNPTEKLEEAKISLQINAEKCD